MHATMLGQVLDTLCRERERESTGVGAGGEACPSRMPDMLLQFARNVQRPSAKRLLRIMLPDLNTPTPSWELPTVQGARPQGANGQHMPQQRWRRRWRKAEATRRGQRLPFVCHSICVAYGAVSISVNVSVSLPVSIYESVSVSWQLHLIMHIDKAVCGLGQGDYVLANF